MQSVFWVKLDHFCHIKLMVTSTCAVLLYQSLWKKIKILWTPSEFTHKNVRLCSTLCPTHIFPLDPLKQPWPPSDQPVYETLVLPLLLMMHIDTNGFDYKMADCWMFLTTVLFKSLESGRFLPFIQQGCIKLIKCDSKCCSFELFIYQRRLKKENHSLHKKSKQFLTRVMTAENSALTSQE